MCPTGYSKVSELASKLLRLIKSSYEWAENSVNFSFKDLRKGLNWLTKKKCPTCFCIEKQWFDIC